MTAAATAFSRAAVMALLRSPLLEVQVDGRRVEASDVRALGVVLADRRASGDARSFLGEVEAAGNGHHRGLDLGRASHAARAAARVADALDPCRTAASASAQVRTLVAFLQAHERVQPGSDDPQQRGRRARRAVLASLVTAADAFARHDDRPRPIDAIAAFLHHVIEGQTFAPARSHAGVHLVDAVAARFGAFDDVYLVGLVETDWSERPRRNVFYAAPLLKALGWPQDQDHVRAQQAAFRDVLTLARYRTRLSAFQLDGDTVVDLSTMIDAARTCRPLTKIRWRVVRSSPTRSSRPRRCRRGSTVESASGWRVAAPAAQT